MSRNRASTVRGSVVSKKTRISKKESSALGNNSDLSVVQQKEFFAPVQLQDREEMVEIIEDDEEEQQIKRQKEQLEFIVEKLRRQKHDEAQIRQKRQL